MYYCQYLNKENLSITPFCLLNDSTCLHLRYCSQIREYYNGEYAINCKIKEKYKMNKNVKFGRGEFLFVDLGTYTVQVKNPFDYVPDNVEVIQIGYNYFVKGYEPKIEIPENEEIYEDELVELETEEKQNDSIPVECKKKNKNK